MIALRPLAAPRYVPWWICVLGLAALYVPTIVDLMRTIWTTEEQSQGPIVLAICERQPNQKDWRIADARRAVADLDRRAALDPAQRELLERL